MAQLPDNFNFDPFFDNVENPGEYGYDSDYINYDPSFDFGEYSEGDGSLLPGYAYGTGEINYSNAVEIIDLTNDNAEIDMIDLTNDNSEPEPGANVADEKDANDEPNIDG